MALIVHKYGGTSMGSTERIRSVAQRVAKWARAGHKMVVVPSAMSGETNRLLGLAKPLKIRFSNPSGKDVEGRSFPSSHTINTITVALVCACFYRPFGWLAFIPALCVGYSRIYTGSHWPSDVLTSIFIGLGATLLLLCALEALYSLGDVWWRVNEFDVGPVRQRRPIWH